MRIVFFFSSLIQSLIIVSLVLFLIYGQPEKSAEEKRVQVCGFIQFSYRYLVHATLIFNDISIGTKTSSAKMISFV